MDKKSTNRQLGKSMKASQLLPLLFPALLLCHTHAAGAPGLVRAEPRQQAAKSIVVPVPASQGKMNLFPATRTLEITDASGKVSRMSLDRYIEGEIANAEVAMAMSRAGADLKADPYPCDLSPCQTGRVYYDTNLGRWNFNPNPQNYDSNGALSDEMSLGEYDLMKWLNWRESQCDAMSQELAIYYTVAVGMGGACLSVNNAGSAALCVAGMVATGYQFNSFISAYQGCYSTYTFGGGG